MDHPAAPAAETSAIVAAARATAAAPAGPPVFRARGLGKTYHAGDVAVQALREVDLDIPAGEFPAGRPPAPGNFRPTLLGRLGVPGLPPDLHHIVDVDGPALAPSGNGLLLTDRLADQLRVQDRRLAAKSPP